MLTRPFPTSSCSLQVPSRSAILSLLLVAVQHHGQVHAELVPSKHLNSDTSRQTQLGGTPINHVLSSCIPKRAGVRCPLAIQPACMQAGCTLCSEQLCRYALALTHRPLACWVPTCAHDAVRDAQQSASKHEVLRAVHNPHRELNLLNNLHMAGHGSADWCSEHLLTAEFLYTLSSGKHLLSRHCLPGGPPATPPSCCSSLSQAACATSTALCQVQYSCSACQGCDAVTSSYSITNLP